MAKVEGNLTGLKAGQIKRLNNFLRRRMTEDRLPGHTQARDLAGLSHDIGRQLGLLVDRRGRIERLVVGGPEGVAAPDYTRLRGGGQRLAGFHFLRTDLADAAPSQADLADLARQRWDFTAVLQVEPEGGPGLMSLSHLLPSPQEGEDIRVLPLFAPGEPPTPAGEMVRALEEELARQRASLAVGREGAAILVSVTTGSRAEAEEGLDELADLAVSAGLSVVGRVIQRRQKIDPRTLLGPGKLNEVLMTAMRSGAGVLVFDQNLNPSQAHALAAYTSADLKFIDRTQLILDIFAQRARTREGKLQVEMAQLRYLMPRLSTRDDGLSRLTGGIGGRGPGETKLEIDRRRVRTRLDRLKRDLKAMAGQRARRRDHRMKQGLPVISIVGYTNAGKSTLLNALTKSRVKAEDRLFATLDPTTRRLRFPKEREVIITDTVGFIRDLPPDLQTAFAATLEELSQAGLLLHVADAGHPQVGMQIKAVERILDELDVSRAPRLLVLNKMDAADPEQLAALTARHQAVAISALDAKTLPPLLERIADIVFMED